MTWFEIIITILTYLFIGMYRNDSETRAGYGISVLIWPAVLLWNIIYGTFEIIKAVADFASYMKRVDEAGLDESEDFEIGFGGTPVMYSDYAKAERDTLAAFLNNSPFDMPWDHKETALTMLTPYEVMLWEAMVQARGIQEYLWADQSWVDRPFIPEEWADLFRKRVNAISNLDLDNVSYKVEMRKRLLQLASLSLKAIQCMNNPEFAKVKYDTKETDTQGIQTEETVAEEVHPSEEFFKAEIPDAAETDESDREGRATERGGE